MNIKTTIVAYPQGSEGWAQHRAISFNASELAAAMRLSPYTTYNELIAQKATGLVPEIDAAKQRIFDDGHRYEAIARSWAEEIIGDDLCPVVLAAEIDGMRLSASLDGLTIANDVTWEHKSLNENLRQSLDAGIIPAEYHPQMEQGLMLSGASRCLFMASNGDRATMRFAWYESQPELRARIIPTWKQVQADVAAYIPAAPAPKPTGKAPDTLPALRIELSGQVTASNLAEFREVALSAIRSVNRDLITDSDFADAEKAVKWCADVETRIKAAKEHALSQTATIDALFKTLEDITAEARTVRLDLEKLVKAEKEARKGQIVKAAQDKMRAHMRGINAELGNLELAMPMDAINDLAVAVKGKRDLALMEDACAAVVSRRCAEFEELARRIRANRALLEAADAEHPGIAPDARVLAHTKAPEDLSAILAQRVAERKAAIERAEKAALERAERERIEREQQAARLAEQERQRAEAARQAREAADAARLAAEAAAAQRAADHIVAANKMVEAPQPPVAVIEAAPATIKLSDINRHIAPLMIDRAGLRTLGFEPQTAKDWAPLLYRASDLPEMVKAMKRVLNAVLLAEAA